MHKMSLEFLIVSISSRKTVACEDDCRNPALPYSKSLCVKSEHIYELVSALTTSRNSQLSHYCSMLVHTVARFHILLPSHLPVREIDSRRGFTYLSVTLDYDSVVDYDSEVVVRMCIKSGLCCLSACNKPVHLSFLPVLCACVHSPGCCWVSYMAFLSGTQCNARNVQESRFTAYVIFLQLRVTMLLSPQAIER